MSDTMRAVVITAPGGPEVLEVRDVPVPPVGDGEVRIRVRSFGLNRSELHFRSGVAHTGSFPRIPGIEAVGEVDASSSGDFVSGQQVAAMMGGMGRVIDGGYAEFVTVPSSLVVPFTSLLGWDQLGAVPEMLQTANGSLEIGLQAVHGQSVLIRGGTSSVGLTIAVLAKLRGMTVLATTRSPDRAALLESVGVDHVVIDDGEIAEKVRALVPGGVDGAVELVGVDVMQDTLRSVRTGGTVCFTGMLSDNWTIANFYPMAWLPNGVRLTAYSGEAADLPQHALQEYLDSVAAGHARVPIGRVYSIGEIAQAHRDMEAGVVSGKGVVVL